MFSPKIMANFFAIMLLIPLFVLAMESTSGNPPANDPSSSNAQENDPAGNPPDTDTTTPGPPTITLSLPTMRSLTEVLRDIYLFPTTKVDSQVPMFFAAGNEEAEQKIEYLNGKFDEGTFANPASPFFIQTREGGEMDSPQQQQVIVEFMAKKAINKDFDLVAFKRIEREQLYNGSSCLRLYVSEEGAYRQYLLKQMMLHWHKNDEELSRILYEESKNFQKKHLAHKSEKGTPAAPAEGNLTPKSEQRELAAPESINQSQKAPMVWPSKFGMELTPKSTPTKSLSLPSASGKVPMQLDPAENASSENATESSGDPQPMALDRGKAPAFESSNAQEANQSNSAATLMSTFQTILQNHQLTLENTYQNIQANQRILGRVVYSRNSQVNLLILQKLLQHIQDKQNALRGELLYRNFLVGQLANQGRLQSIQRNVTAPESGGTSSSRKRKEPEKGSGSSGSKNPQSAGNPGEFNLALLAHLYLFGVDLHAKVLRQRPYRDRVSRGKRTMTAQRMRHWSRDDENNARPKNGYTESLFHRLYAQWMEETATRILRHLLATSFHALRTRELEGGRHHKEVEVAKWKEEIRAKFDHLTDTIAQTFCE